MRLRFVRSTAFGSISDDVLESSYLFFLAKDRVNVLRKQVNYIARSLLAIQTELEMKMGVCDYTEELKELASNIENHVNAINGLGLTK